MIRQFQHEYRWLSNFWPAPIAWHGVIWPHVEAAYQWAKVSTSNQLPIFLADTNPVVSKRRGASASPLRPDWELIKYDIMHFLVTQKFIQNLNLAQRLLATGDCLLEEGNYHKDMVWGICPPMSGNGKNWLGLILMEVRRRLRAEDYSIPVIGSKFYAGIGSRETPDNILQQMELIAREAAAHQWTLRSGGADGADSAFELGAVEGGGMMDIFLSKKRRDHPSELTDVSPFNLSIAASIHKKWYALSDSQRGLLGRNVCQMMGRHTSVDSELTKFVACWTPDGCESEAEYSIRTGGTGLAIALADRLQIPVYNLANPGRLDKIREAITGKPVTSTGLNIDETISWE